MRDACSTDRISHNAEALTRGRASPNRG